MRAFIVALAVMGFGSHVFAQDQATQLGKASAQVADALNRFAEAAEPVRPKMTADQRMGISLFFAAAMALEDNSLSLSALCQMQSMSKAPAVTNTNIVMPLVGQYRTSNAQQTANLSLALPSLPTSLMKQASLVMVAGTNVAAVVDRGCR